MMYNSIEDVLATAFILGIIFWAFCTGASSQIELTDEEKERRDNFY